MALKVDCGERTDRYVDFKILMETEEWDNLQYMHFEEDASGLVRDTEPLIRDCKVKWRTYTMCTVRLGYYENAEELGLSSEWQTQAGWINPVGGKGWLQTRMIV
jgi:hypothetical protein